MRNTLPAVAALLLMTACGTDDPPVGSWRSGAWTCLKGCADDAPTITEAAWVVAAHDGTNRWFNAGGALLHTGSAVADGSCWATSADGAAFALCACDAAECVEVARAQFGAQVWRFDAVR